MSGETTHEIVKVTPALAATVGLVPQEWSPGGNRCQKPTNGKTGRCHNRARWCDTEAGERYDRYARTWTQEPGSYAYKVCDRHALAMIRATPPAPVTADLEPAVGEEL